MSSSRMEEPNLTLMKLKLGKAFFDNVVISKNPSRRVHTPLRGWGARLTLFYLLLIGAFFILCMRLFHLTIVQGKENRVLSENNRIKEVVIHAPRGILYDRMRKSLVENAVGARIVGPCEENCRPRLVSEAELTRSDELLHSVFWERDFLRTYLYPFEFSHVIGHLGEVSREEIGSPSYIYQSYLTGDRIGRMGLESAFEKHLRGSDGKELIEVDAQGKKMRSLGKVDPIPGKDLYLSLDVNMQKAAYMALGENPGAVVVSKPHTGEILAFVSTPGFDTNELNRGITEEKYRRLSKDDRPLFNRALSGVYPPGSTFKLISAVAALESGKVKADNTVEDTGILRVGEFSFANWYFTQSGGKDGMVDLTKALARSNDIYFYKLGETVGVSEIAKWGHKFGLGGKTGIELSGEAEGIMPDPGWRRKVRGLAWYLGDTYHLAIGQGELSTTPLQVNLWTNVIASEGVLCTPTLLRTHPSADGSELKSQPCRDLKIKKQTIEVITEGMYRACSKDEGWGYQGTGWPFFDFTILKETLSEEGGSGEKRRISIACKTGTAEVGDTAGKTHAWFTAFAPVGSIDSGNQNIKQDQENYITGDPEIVVTVLVEKGGEGSSVAGPIAKKVMEEWFKR